ncbi:MAG: DMT family transporter [Candidatus Nanopelagicales bacterium]|jgi:transporter family-2 protein
MSDSGRSTATLIVMAGSALGVGALTAVQARANGSLAISVGSGLQAATVSFAVGLIVLTAIGLARPKVRQGLGLLKTAVAEGAQPAWVVLGGISGGLFIATQSLSVPVIGVALFSVSLVGGQIASSLLVDARGWGPRGRQALTPARFAAAVLGLAAVVTASGGRWDEGPGAIAWAGLCVITGAAVAWQQAANGRVTAVSRTPIVAAWINFMLGGAIVAGIWAVNVGLGIVDAQPLPSGPPWLYAGGVIGATFLAATAWVVGRIGVLAVTLLVTAGQLVGALALDYLLLHLVDGLLVAGTALAFLAVTTGAIGHRWPGLRSRSTS